MNKLQMIVLATLAIVEAVVVAIIATQIDVESANGLAVLMATGGIFAGLAALTVT